MQHSTYDERVSKVCLTLVDIDKSSGKFTVHLIPETLEKTTFAMKKVGDPINMEIDAQTQAIVDTILSGYAPFL